MYFLKNIEGRMLVPIRAISEEMGAEVGYEHETRTVTILDGDNEIVLKIGEATAYINGEATELDVPANVIDWTYNGSIYFSRVYGFSC